MGEWLHAGRASAIPTCDVPLAGDGGPRRIRLSVRDNLAGDGQATAWKALLRQRFGG